MTTRPIKSEEMVAKEGRVEDIEEEEEDATVQVGAYVIVGHNWGLASLVDVLLVILYIVQNRSIKCHTFAVHLALSYRLLVLLRK